MCGFAELKGGCVFAVLREPQDGIYGKVPVDAVG